MGCKGRVVSGEERGRQNQADMERRNTVGREERGESRESRGAEVGCVLHGNLAGGAGFGRLVRNVLRKMGRGNSKTTGTGKSGNEFVGRRGVWGNRGGVATRRMISATRWIEFRVQKGVHWGMKGNVGEMREIRKLQET